MWTRKLLPILSILTFAPHVFAAQQDLSAMSGLWKVTAADEDHVKTGDILKIVLDSSTGTFRVVNINDPIPGTFFMDACDAINQGSQTDGKVYAENTDTPYSEIKKSYTTADTLTCKQSLPYGDEDSVHLITTYKIRGSEMKVKDYYHAGDRKKPDLHGTATLERIGDL